MFREPDWSQRVDFAARLSAVPEAASMRGMFIQFLLASTAPEVQAKYAARRYIAFKSYSMREYVEIMKDACEAMPRQSHAQCLRKLGFGVYPNYAKTITGTAIFAVAGRSFQRMIEVSPAAYRIGLPPATVTVQTLGDRHARVELRECWNVPEFHQVGIWEGAMQVCGVQGEIQTEALGFGAVDFDISWG
jgi:uncharacterized protein (TIGR02265 family)